MQDRGQFVVERLGKASSAVLQLCRHPIRKGIIPMLLALLARIDPTWE
jgi:hypothetical protein